MTNVGIEALNVYAGVAKLDLQQFAQARNLAPDRFRKLLMHEKTVALPTEDAVSYAVNAAKLLIDEMSDAERNAIELLIVCTESGIDFGKTTSTYVHDYLNLSRNCRMFELKQACYSGAAGLQMAANLILSQTSAGAKALVIASDISRAFPHSQNSAYSEEESFAEPSSGAGAVAFIVSDKPNIFQLDIGASGFYGFEVLDTARPTIDAVEFGDNDVSLLAYLDCCENAYRHYTAKVDGVDFGQTFGYLAYHTPFGGMVKGAHQMMLRKFLRMRGEASSADFQTRVIPSLRYCQQVGNIMGATIFLALASLIDHAPLPSPQRVGLFSYGSGCCSEFFSGVVTPNSKAQLARRGIGGHIGRRIPLTMSQYDKIVAHNHQITFGTRNVTPDLNLIPDVRQQIEGSGLLMLNRIDNYHRKYEWV